ncbi:hypothetical protein PLICRDRAFT_45885 [Plicaturopsis crispa FD-325 SS-3]|uniref:COP9 signalosome complex subunit 3 n=1 Tax=Plicaturopsis crispa FD-325 SS-3 TaxID=944288 RepID=A0A0C9T8I9_PLICR|nr:hypothetical protein PLICRDRAFT_45885 [Plicaturopsis crispa FD-325 SS-3]
MDQSTGLPTPPLQPGSSSSSSNPPQAAQPQTSDAQQQSQHQSQFYQADATASLEGLVHQITTTNNIGALNHALRNFAQREVRETVLASLLGGGQDPLTVLDVRVNTLGVLYILSARLHSTHVPNAAYVTNFCRNFTPEQARYAPDRVTLLAKGIKRVADNHSDPKFALQPLYDLVTRYPPQLSYLTTIHPIFVSVCVATQHFANALPVLAVPITTIDTALSDLTYNDNLTYHYAGGMALAALKRWDEAELFFETCVSSPGQAPAALQMEALKKLVLIQLISKGKTSPPPKYTHHALPRLFKNTPYAVFVNHYPQQTQKLRDLVDKERQLFSTENNIGLLLQALDRAPRWSIKKLTATYLTLGLAEIGQAVNIDSEDAVRAIVLSMIESEEISAQISASGTVTFTDPPPQFTKADVDAVLLEASVQGALLEKLERDMARSREYITKVVRSKDDVWGPPGEEDLQHSYAGGASASAAFADDSMFS